MCIQYVLRVLCSTALRREQGPPSSQPQVENVAGVLTIPKWMLKIIFELHIAGLSFISDKVLCLSEGSVSDHHSPSLTEPTIHPHLYYPSLKDLQFCKTPNYLVSLHLHLIAFNSDLVPSLNFLFTCLLSQREYLNIFFIWEQALDSKVQWAGAGS